MQIFELINLGSKKLKNKSILTHQLDSELIISKILRKKREQILANSDRSVSKNIIYDFDKLIKRRSLNEPIAYIFKKKEFWSKDFYVNKNTLIPRPETELLAEKIVDLFKHKKLFILDIGTGSGCILLSILLELKKSKGVGIDISKNAIKVAIRNSKKFNLESRAKFHIKSFVEITDNKFDLIVSNPPYIPTSELKNLADDIKKFEPKIALDGGNDGLDVIRKVIYKSCTILKKKGMLALEIGNGQYNSISQILKYQGYKELFLVKDYEDNIRCILAELKN